MNLENTLERLWDRDGSLWCESPDDQREAERFLGWLDLPERMQGRIDEIERFAQEVRPRLSHVVILGMGGSSLCSEVFARVFGPQQGSPKLIVLDSVIPAAILSVTAEIELESTLFVVASKSGSTIEPMSLYRFFSLLLREAGLRPGDHMIAITDPGSQLEELARAESFLHTFLNFEDVGGRFSALSFFGLVPAALMGLDVRKLIARAGDEMGRSRAPDGEGPRLGHAMGEGWASGRDKLTLRLPERLSSLGIWIEQLVAESTGKQGRGILPVHDEPVPSDTLAISEDRFFVCYGREESSAPQAYVIDPPADSYDVARQFVIWEVATAVAGARLQVNPFDQPDVQAAKLLTKRILERESSEDPVTPSSSDPDAVVAAIRNAAYVAILIYDQETPGCDASVERLRRTIVEKRGIATTVGFGPRYLHSTGQYHKGAEAGGVHIFVVPPVRDDIEIPGAGMTFGKLAHAQARGDIGALEARDRTVFRFTDIDSLETLASRID